MSESDGTTDYEDVDEIIGLAEEMKQKEQSALSNEELEEVGAELDISPEYLERARNELERRRRQEDKREKRENERRERWRRRAVIACGAVALGFAVWSWIAVSQLSDLHAAVESQRAEIRNQHERKAAIEEQFADQPDSLEKQAQLTGSENRLRVAIQRYNESAAAYNRRASGLPASLWRGLAGLPAEAPMGDELPTDP